MSARWLVAVVLMTAGILSLTASPASADHQPFEEGDLLVSVGGGIIRRFEPDGDEVEDVDTETGSAEIGDMCFSDDAMYSMNFQDESISKFDGRGALIESRWATLDGSPESCVLNEDGDLFIGMQDSVSSAYLQQLDGDGDVVQTFSPELDASGVDQIDLAADQCTLLYNSETGTILAYDVCDDEQLPNFAEGLGDTCNNLRIRPNEEVLIACDAQVLRLDSGGDEVQTYSPDGAAGAAGGLFALNLDNDGEHFYTATYVEGLVWRIDIDSGDGSDEPYIQTTVEGDSIGGLAIAGEIAVAQGEVTFVRDVPSIVQAVPDPRDISTEPDVVGTNALFAIVIAIVILLSAQIFNDTIKENNNEVEGFVKRYVRPLGKPFASLGKTVDNAGGGTSPWVRFASIGSFILATAVIYGFLEPDFAFDGDGINLVLSMVIALAAVTYVYGGAEGRLTERWYGAASAVKVFPVALVIAVISVLVSRLINFEPGIVFGFVAANTVVAAGVDIETRKQGRVIVFAVLALLAAFAVAWGLLIPIREFVKEDANPLSVLLDSAATLIVVGSIQALCFTLVPVQFTDGRKLWAFNRVVWFLLFALVVFLFYTVIIFQDEGGIDAIGKEGTKAALIALGVCVGVTAAAWGFFAYRRSQEAKAALAPAGDPAPPVEHGAGATQDTEPAGDAGPPEEQADESAEELGAEEVEGAVLDTDDAAAPDETPDADAGDAGGDGSPDRD